MALSNQSQIISCVEFLSGRAAVAQSRYNKNSSTQKHAAFSFTINQPLSDSVSRVTMGRGSVSVEVVVQFHVFNAVPTAKHFIGQHNITLRHSMFFMCVDVFVHK